MISEGSVLAARSEPTGVAVDVAPDGFAHPVYRSGLALALKLPALDELTLQSPVELPAEGDFEQLCEEPAKPQFDESIHREEESVAEDPAAAEEDPTA
jgi:hypothetical protein